MALPGHFFLNGQNIPDHAAIQKNDHQGNCDQTIIFSEDPTEKNKTEEHINNSTGTNMIWTPANKPGKQSQKQCAGNKDLQGDFSVEIPETQQQ